MSEQLGYNVQQSAYSRVHLIQGRVRADHKPDFRACMKLGAPSQNFGAVSKIECPDPENPGQFITVGKMQEASERGQQTVVGRYGQDIASEILRLAKKRCPVDVLMLIGACSDLKDYDDFAKAQLYTDVVIEQWSTDDQGALESGENAVVNETGTFSYDQLYELLPLSAAEKGGSVVVNPIVDGLICDKSTCGDCGLDESDGCEIALFVTAFGPGSPGTAPDIVWSSDKGQNWALDEINVLTAAQDPNGITCLRGYAIVISEDAESYAYKKVSTITAGTLLGWTEITGGFVAGNGPLGIWAVSDYAFIVGENGYIYGLDAAGENVSTLDAGVATTNNLNAVHALSDQFAVAVGASDTIVYTVTRDVWATATATGGGNNLLTVWCRNRREWWVGDDAGALWYTLDGGATWTQKTIPGSVSQINKIRFAIDAVGYLAGETAAAAGRVLRTNTGGYSWVVLPEGVQALPASDSIDALAVCKEDPNFVIAGGLADDGSDGIIIVLED